MNLEQRIIQVVANLDPSFEQRVQSWERYGLPASSLPGGSRSAELPCPVNKTGTIPDALDRDIRKHRRERTAALERALVALLLVDGIEQTYRALPHAEASKLAAEARSPKAQNCKNDNCSRPVERTPNDRLRAGRCMACYQWFQSHGSERPRERCEAWIEKQQRLLAERRTDPKILQKAMNARRVVTSVVDSAQSGCPVPAGG